MDRPDPTLLEAYDAYLDVGNPDEPAIASTWDALRRRIEAGETGPSLACDPGGAELDQAEPVAAHVETVAPLRSGRARRYGIAMVLAASVGALWWLPTGQLLSSAGVDDTYAAGQYDANATTDAGAAAIRTDDDLAPTRASARSRPPSLATPPAPLEDLGDVVPQLDAPVVAPLPATRPIGAAPRGRGRVPVATPEPEPEPEALADQATALQRARILLRNDPQAALDQVDAHRLAYPSSPFAREREALSLLATCALGRSSDVQARVRTFVDAQSTSPLAERVREACQDSR